MAGVCGDNRFEIIAKVKEHLIKATNIEMQPEELKYADNLLFRLWQLGYFDSVEKISKLEAKIAHLTRHLEPQSMTTLFEQVEEEVKQEQKIKELEEELEHERKTNEEIKVRFVKCSSCTEEMKDKCLMFSENLCEGERCEELVDLVALVNQSELQNRCSDFEQENAELKKELEVHDEWAENFKQKHYDEIALKDEEINYLSEQIQELKIELDTPESVVLDKLDEAKDLLKRFIETNEPVYFDEDRQRFRKLKIEAEEFLRSE